MGFELVLAREGVVSPNDTIRYAIGANYSGAMWVIDANYESSQSDTLVESNLGDKGVITG
jgi:hypothetical protein